MIIVERVEVDGVMSRSICISTGTSPTGDGVFLFLFWASMGLIISVSLSAGPTRRPDLGEAAGSWSKWCAPPSPPVFQIRGPTRCPL